ncbi:MAG: hypothetical protein ACR2N6_07970 [Miltoncostaeaceae bacterium]
MPRTSDTRAQDGPALRIWSSENQRAEALTNAIYGTIIMAAFFAVVDGLVDSAAEVLAELIFATLVLFLAHLFAAAVGAGAASDRRLSPSWALRILGAQLPLVLVVTPPMLLLAVASTGAFSVEVAVRVSMAYSVGFLFSVSFLLARHHGRGAARSALYGAIGAGLGIAVIGLEAALH